MRLVSELDSQNVVVYSGTTEPDLSFTAISEIQRPENVIGVIVSPPVQSLARVLESVYNPVMTKAHAAEKEFGDFIQLIPGVGPHGRYVLKDSGFPVSSLYQFFVEGYSNEEIAAMLNGLTAEDVAKVHAFIDALI